MDGNVFGVRCNPFQSDYLTEVFAYQWSIRQISAPKFRPDKITKPCPCTPPSNR